MKLAVNIHCLHPPVTGIGHYARHLLLEMLSDPAVESVVGISQTGWHDRAVVETMVESARGYTREEEPAASPRSPRNALRIARAIARRIPGASRLRSRISHALQQRLAKQFADHVYWEPNYLLLPVDNPAVATVHDLSHLRYPHFHPSSRLAELQHLPETLARCERIVTVSEFTRSEMTELLGVDQAKVAVVSPAVSDRFRPRTPEESAQVREHYGLPTNFVLYAGTIEPRKNLPALMEAYSLLPKELQASCPLVLAGGRGWHPETFESVLAKLDNPNILELGYVDHEDLPLLFGAATVFAYPSLYEGFGMPVLEAMASGTAVLTSDAASMPEVAASAASLVDPESVSDINSGLERLLNSATLRQQQIESGLVVARGHSWENSWSRLRAVLAEVVR